ncbi:hypothetical protein STEG23_003007 [Scotinomys teguina]
MSSHVVLLWNSLGLLLRYADLTRLALNSKILLALSPEDWAMYSACKYLLIAFDVGQILEMKPILTMACETRPEIRYSRDLRGICSCCMNGIYGAQCLWWYTLHSLGSGGGAWTCLDCMYQALLTPHESPCLGGNENGVRIEDINI